MNPAWIKTKLNDSPVARWTVLFLVAYAMMMGYYVTYQMSPLEHLLESPVAEGGLGWSSTDYGFVSSAYGFINVFLFMLFIGGVILDKMGVRFTGMLACSLMVLGVSILYYAIEYVPPTRLTVIDCPLLGFHHHAYKTQVLLSALGFSIFGVGDEMCGITTSKAMVKWFTGHELALAMGIQVAMARLGTGAAMTFSVSMTFGHRLSTPILVGTALLITGLLAYLVYCIMDVKLDKSVAHAPKKDTAKDAPEEERFRLSDILLTLKSAGFWHITAISLLYYSAMSPFLNFATKLMISKYGIDEAYAGAIPAIIPFGSILLTPLFGTVYDRIGRGATLIIVGTSMLTAVHLMLSLPVYSGAFAVMLMIILGVAFSLVPGVMWPSVPKIIPLKRLGNAYSIIFFIQNIGLMVVRFIIGKVLDVDSHTLSDGRKIIDFTHAQWIFAAFGLGSVLFSISLKWLDARKNYGLERSNIRQTTAKS